MCLTRFLWRVCRQLNVERTSLAHDAPHPDASAVRFHDELAEREPESRATHSWHMPRLDASEFLEYQIVKLFRNSRPVVLDSKQHPVLLAARRDSQLDRTARMRQRILKDVGEHALEQRLVGLERRCVLGDRRYYRSTFLSEAYIPLVENLRDECTGRDFLTLEHDPGLLDLGDFEQIADETKQFFRLCLGVAQRLALFEGDGTEVAITHHLERRQHRCERSLEVVNDHLHKIVAHLL